LNRLHFLGTFNPQVVNALILVESNVLIAGHHRGEGDGWRCLVEPLTGVTGREIRTPQSLGSADIIIVLRVNQGYISCMLLVQYATRAITRHSETGGMKH
jgi:hypothetical protein